jgi:hypothetical protein
MLLYFLLFFSVYDFSTALADQPPARDHDSDSVNTAVQETIFNDPVQQFSHEEKQGIQHNPANYKIWDELNIEDPKVRRQLEKELVVKLRLPLQEEMARLHTEIFKKVEEYRDPRLRLDEGVREMDKAKREGDEARAHEIGQRTRQTWNKS